MKYKMFPLSTPCWCNITYHAVEQFIARWEPNKNSEQARDQLIIILQSAKQVGKTHTGDAIYVSGQFPDIRVVVKDRNVCVTVLPLPNTISVDLLYQEELQRAQELIDMRNERIGYEIADLEKELVKINEQQLEIKKQIEALTKQFVEPKQKLAEKKSELLNQIFKLKQQIKYDL